MVCQLRLYDWELGESGLNDEDTKHPKIARLLQFLISATTKSVPLIPFRYKMFGSVVNTGLDWNCGAHDSLKFA